MLAVLAIIAAGCASDSSDSGGGAGKQQPPVADAGGPYTGIAGQAVAMSAAASTDPNNDPLTYTWNFGDNATGTGPTPSHSYAAPGTYTVTVTVADPSNASHSASTTATISSPPISVSNALEGEVGSPLGGQNGLVFGIAGSPPSQRFYWTVTGPIPPELTRLPLNDTTPATTPSNTFTLQGAPTSCRSFSIQITVHNVPDRSVLVPPTTLTIVIGRRSPELCPPPTISTNTLTLFRDVPTRVAFQVEGGKPDFRWSESGLAAAGLTLDPATGVVSGTPRTPGTFSIALTVVDGAGRQANKSLDLVVRAFNLADAKGTWSGVIRRGTLVLGPVSNLTYQSLTNQNKRLSLLITGDQNSPPQVAPLSSGTLDSIVLNPQPVAFSLTPAGGYPEPFNARIDQLNLHFGCNIVFEGRLNLECTGHSFFGGEYDLVVTLARLSAAEQDTTSPRLVSIVPETGASASAFFEATLTFDEPMSSSGVASITDNAVVGPIVFTTPTTAVVPLFGLRSNTAYTLTLNPNSSTGSRFMDVAGNPLPTSVTTFTTGVLTPARLTVSKTGTGLVTSNPPGILCEPASASCIADFSQGTTVTLTATPTPDSQFNGWSLASCAGVGSCTVTLQTNTVIAAAFEALPRYTLTVDIGGSGTVETPRLELICSSATQCSGEFVAGTIVPLTAIPDPGHTFGSWGGACSGNAACNLTMDSDKTASITFPAIPDHRLTVNKAGNGTVTSSPNPLINCGPVCSWEFAQGTNVLLTASPDSGFTFAGWSGPGITCSGSCNVHMDAAKTVTATFTAIPTYTLSVAKNGSGAVRSAPGGIDCGATCSADFQSPTAVLLTAEPAAGFSFASWSGACAGSTTCQVTMSADRNVTATFDVLPTHALSITVAGSGGGRVTIAPPGINCTASCSQDFSQGANPTLTATPNADSVFAGWSGAGCSGTGQCQVTMTSTRSVTATFNLKAFPLTVTKSGSGSGTVTSNPGGIDCGSTCSLDFPVGQSVTLTALPGSGSAFTGWTGGCGGTGTCSVTINAATFMTATFAPTYPLTVTVLGNGTVSSAPSGITNCATSCASNFAGGTNVTLTATPASGFVLSAWSGPCAGTGVCIVPMTGAQTVTATFVTQNHALTVSLDGTGAGTVSSIPPGIACGTDCSEDYPSGTVVTLTALPNSGVIFVGWSGVCSGVGACIVTMSGPRTVFATFNTQTGVIARSQAFTFNKRATTAPTSKARHAITLTGSAPGGGQVTFRITRFSAHQDPAQSMSMQSGLIYQFVDPVSGALTEAVATTSSNVNTSTGLITGAPVIVWTPRVCTIDSFAQDSFEFVAMDSGGNVSPPATVTMNAPNVTCSN